MQKLKMLPCLLAASVIAGCAAGPQASTEPSADKGEVVTGSNIPRKAKAGPSNVDTVSKEDFERSRNMNTVPLLKGGR
jgi:hypothetical protein